MLHIGTILIKTLCISINVRLLLVQCVENFFDKGLLVVNKSSHCIKKQLIDLPATSFHNHGKIKITIVEDLLP